MKVKSTKQYIKTYNLTKGTNFSYDNFTIDIITEFIIRLENNNAFSNYYKFENVINELHNKYDAINNKTLGNITLWDYIFAEFISTFRDVAFKNRELVMTEDDFINFVVTKITNKYPDAKFSLTM